MKRHLYTIAINNGWKTQISLVFSEVHNGKFNYM